MLGVVGARGDKRHEAAKRLQEHYSPHVSIEVGCRLLSQVLGHVSSMSVV